MFKGLFRSFRVRVTLTLFLALLFTGALSNFLVYQFSLKSQFQQIRSRLMLIAQTAALMIDGDMIQQIPLNRDGIKTPQYKTIAKTLRRIRRISPDIAYIYTMGRTEKPGTWQFIVDPDYAEGMVENDQAAENAATSYPGDVYDASRFPEMMKAFDGPAADSQLEGDEWGVTLSGYAPIRDSAGKAVAMIGVDIMAGDIFNLQREVQRRSIVVLAFGILLAFLLGMIISKNLSTPVKELVEGTRRLSQGELDYQVMVRGEDEISELARSFNQMAKNLSDSREKLLNYFYDVVQSMVRVLEAKDAYTKGHSQAVARYAAQIAEELGIPKAKVELLKEMALVHDIGKVGIREAILNKEGALTPEEWEDMKQHPLIGEAILKPVFGDEEMLAIVRHHHERYDGTGYPDRLNKENINIFAAILAVADAYDAMTSDRAYRPRLNKEKAIAELKKHSGTQFNPKVVDAFLKVLDDNKKI